MKHGIFAQGLVAEGLEQPGEWVSHLDAMREEFQPEGYFETVLVERIAGLLWRLRRVARHEAELLQTSSDLLDSTYDDVQRHLPDVTTVSLISRYESSLHRQFMQMLHELQRRQAARIDGVVTTPVAVDITAVGASLRDDEP